MRHEVIPENNIGKDAGLAEAAARAIVDSRTRSVKKGEHISPNVVSGTVRFLEFALVFLIGFDIWAVYVRPSSAALDWDYIIIVMMTASTAVLLFQSLELYTVQSLRSVVPQVARLVLSWTALFGVLTALAFFTQSGGQFSRIWLAGWYGVGLVMIVSLRVVVSLLVAKWIRERRLERRAVIVGGGERAVDLITALDGSPHTDVHITGVFDDRGDKRSPQMIAGYPKLGTIAQLVEFARHSRIDLLIVSLPLSAENRLLQVLKQLWVLPVDIRLSAHTNKLRFRPRAYSYIGNVPFFDVFDKPLTDWDYIAKSIEDRVLAAIALVVLSPLMALVALAVRLDSPGPVFFKQKRYGFNNELVEVYKFRSLSHAASDASAAKLVTRGDKRVTRVGRFIRKTSLDELPQFFNVLKGDLSLVGPRPHAVMAKAEDQLYVDVVESYFARHRVKPGVTGWAQVNGWRGETDTAEKIQRRVEFDLYYIENWSIWLDLYIMAMTPFSLINSDSAY